MKSSPVGRRLRISSVRSGSTEGHTTVIHDADTGESIYGVSRIVLTMDVKGPNTALVTYFDVDDNGGTKPVDGNVLYKTVEKKNVEIDNITAFDMDNIRKKG
jgi:hypothetical protein